MRYTVWSNGRLLGETDLALPNAVPDIRLGNLEPSAELARVWTELGPVIDEFFHAGEAVGSTIDSLPPAPDNATNPARGQRVYEWLSAHPGVVRLRAASEAVKAAGIELRDESGNVVPAESVLVQAVRPPADIPQEAIERTMAEARAEGMTLNIPQFIAIVHGAA